VDFLQNFKSSSTEAAEQLENLNLRGDGDSDEYDMVDDSDDPAPDAAQRRTRHNKAKYMQMLQDVSDRTRTEVLIDLNDVETVSV
jgi:DNA replication licensing factor MCM7